MSRYHVSEGIVIRRKQLPNGDVLATLFGDSGKWTAVARKGRLVGGNPGKLSLFHDVSVQYYRKKDEDLAVITQVQLNGALPRLSDPDVYPYAHVLAELIDQLSVDVHVGEQSYAYLASGLRGLNQAADPEAVAIVYAWKLLQQAGLAPRVTRCVMCNQATISQRFDVAAGGFSCANCATGMPVAESTLSELVTIMTGTVRQALACALVEREQHWLILMRYCAFHVADLRSVASLRRERVTRPEAPSV